MTDKFAAILTQYEGLDVYAQITVWDDAMRVHAAKVLSDTLTTRSIEIGKKCLTLWIENLDITEIGSALRGNFTSCGVTVLDQIQCFGSIRRVLYYVGELSEYNVDRASEEIVRRRG